MLVEDQTRIRGINIPLVIAGLCMAFCMVPIDITIANVAIVNICGDLGVEVTKGKSIATAYFIGEAIGLPLTGCLVRKFGDIRLYFISLILFGIFSFTCAISFDLEMLVFSRLLQGVASAPIIPLSQSLLFRCLPQDKGNIGITIMSLFYVISIISAPIIGGWLTTYYGWPWIFKINIPIVLISLFILWTQIRNKDLPVKKERLDWIGLFLLSFAVIAWQIFLDFGQEWDWWNSQAIVTLFWLVFIAATLLICYEFYRPNPLLNLRLFKKRNFTVINLLMWLAIAVDLGSFIIIPLWLQTYKNYNALWAGLAMAPFGVGAILAGLLSNSLIKRVGLFNTTALGSLLVAYGCFYQSFIQIPDIDIYHLLFSRFIMGSGILLNYICLTLICKQEFKPEEQPEALGIFQFSRSIFAATGISLFFTLWLRRTITYHNILIEKTSSFSLNVKNYIADLQTQGFTHQQALEKLNQTTDLQAATLSINDCLFAMGWLSILMFFLCFLGKKQQETNHAIEMV